MRQRIVVRDGAALAYTQSYPAHHWPAPHFAGLPADAVALDVFSGPDGMGQGGAWLRALGDLLLLDCSTLAIDPAPENQRAIAAYRKAGGKIITYHGLVNPPSSNSCPSSSLTSVVLFQAYANLPVRPTDLSHTKAPLTIITVSRSWIPTSTISSATSRFLD